MRIHFTFDVGSLILIVVAVIGFVKANRSFDAGRREVTALKRRLKRLEEGAANGG